MAENQDNTQPVAPPSNVTPASNQNLIIGLVMGAVVFLLLLLVINHQGGFGKSEDAELKALKADLAEAQRTKNAAQEAALGLPGGQDANLLVGNIKRDADALVQYIAATQGALSRLRGSEATQQDLYAKIGNLQSQLSQAQGAQNQVAGLQAQLQAAQDRIQTLTNQLTGSVDQSIAASMREQIAGIKQEREDLRTQLAELKAKMMGMVSQSEVAELKKLIPTNLRLRAELQELRAQLESSKKLFVDRENLAPAATSLFQALVRLEGNDQQALAQSYRVIEQDLNARVMEKASFKTGSASLAQEHETHIESVVTNSPKGSFFLVVGYASKTGDVKDNRDLSRKRSTRTASVVNYLISEGHQVQAVYLGETDRFGKEPLLNQVCEVWEIRP